MNCWIVEIWSKISVPDPPTDTQSFSPRFVRVERDQFQVNRPEIGPATPGANPVEVVTNIVTNLDPIASPSPQVSRTSRCTRFKRISCKKNHRERFTFGRESPDSVLSPGAPIPLVWTCFAKKYIFFNNHLYIYKYWQFARLLWVLSLLSCSISLRFWPELGLTDL